MVLDSSMWFFRKPSNVTCFIIYFNMCSQIKTFKNNVTFKGKGMINIWKFVNFGAGNSCHWVRSIKKENGNFSARHLFKVELHCYIYIVISGKHESELHWIVLTFLDPQCIVSQEDFQHKILNWSTLVSLLSLYTSRTEKRGQELWKLSLNSEAAVLNCYIKNVCSENFGKFSRKHPW